ncbi:MAG TPA: hypothetical protein PKI62_10300 [bacterium]|nr:hypothetical protein [bacterium]HPR87437.1 hypothetical protein [bacterium]
MSRFRDLEVIAVRLGKIDAGRLTRLGRRIDWGQATQDSGDLYDKLMEWCGDLIPTVLFPTRDIEVNLLGELADRLPDHFLYYRNSSAIIKALSDKSLVRDTALRAGLKIPKTLLLTDLEQPELAEWRFPALIKPLRQSMSQTPFKNIVVNSREELLDIIEDDHKYLGHVVLQEFVPGGDDHVFHCNLLIDQHDQTIGVVELQKIRQYLPLRGMTSYGKTLLTRELVPLCQRLAMTTGYKGLMNVEFKKDAENGRWVFIEVNLRLPIFNSVFPKSGINLAHLYVRSLLGTVDQPVYATTPATWMHEENDLANILTQKVNTRLSTWLHQFIHTDAFAYWSATDPLPGFYAWSRNLCNGLHKIARSIRSLFPAGRAKKE